ncbi:zinc ribbon domain-containing protein [Paraburkholderia sediminicola]|uniref:FmdB family zinc ribbon protein n=1 Tax=Paraburkholderia sediminicola TaxID=458836 RepID=UPI0038B737E4
MPIYAYRCESCGFGKDVLQKMSDPQLTQCPECGKDTFRKQVTAAGFQLKGSGWYVTDFRGGAKAPAKPDANGGSNANSGENAAAGNSGAANSDTASANGTAAAASSGAVATPAAPAAAPAASASSSGSGSA